MPKRLYLGPGSYWSLPDDTDIALLRDEVYAAVEQGRMLMVTVSTDGTASELLLHLGRVSSVAVVDLPVVPGGVAGPDR
jgi:hypothetical protein